MDDDVTLTLQSQGPMTLPDPGVGARGRVGVLEALIDDAVDHGFPAECANMFREIVYPNQYEVCRPAIQGAPLSRVEHMIVGLQRGARVVLVKPYQTKLACR